MKRTQGTIRIPTHELIFLSSLELLPSWGGAQSIIGGGGAQPNIWGLGHSQRYIKLRS